MALLKWSCSNSPAPLWLPSSPWAPAKCLAHLPGEEGTRTWDEALALGYRWSHAGEGHGNEGKERIMHPPRAVVDAAF